jgi:hypothetical protein
VTDNGEAVKSRKGKMNRRNIPFIKPAHELGHGAFGLKHTDDLEYDMRFDRINLMGYNDKAHLAKFQWDIIHDSKAGETTFDSTDHVMAKLIIIDDKHTKLFNHVYANNLNPYEAGAGSYQSEEWHGGWTYSDDKPEELVEKVIKKVRDAASMPAGTAPDRGKTAVFLAKRHATIDEKSTKTQKIWDYRTEKLNLTLLNKCVIKKNSL